MTEVQEAQNISADPRWIPIRVSRINLAVTGIGALLSFPVLLLLPIPLWVRLALLATFAAAMAWDIYLILLKAPGSAGAFYLFDLDPKADTKSSPGAQENSGAGPARLGIRVRRARTAREVDGKVVPGAFVTPWFTALRYRLPDEPAWRRWWPRVIPLWTDSVDREAFRRVRIDLKWK